jgi:hypothetical protein
MTSFDTERAARWWFRLRGPKAALDAVSELLTQEKTMSAETTLEDLQKLAQRLRRSLSDEDRAALINLLMSNDDAADQPPDTLAQLPESELKHALDRMTPAARRIWRERQARRHASNLEAGLERWPQAARLGIG